MSTRNASIPVETNNPDRLTQIWRMEQAGEMQYNFVSSPIPFECPEAILSSPLSSPTPHTMIMDSHSGVFTPVPCQPRVSTPYPVIDSVISGKDWPAALSPENRIFPSSWSFEPAVNIGQECQLGSVLPVTTATSYSLHHYTFPQTWQHAVPTQNLSGYSLQNSDYWYPGDSPLIDEFGTADEEGEIIEQDSKVTSSTEFASSGYKKCQPYLEISANMAATKKQETQISTGFDRKATSGYEKCQPQMQFSASIPAKITQESKSAAGFHGKEVRTQTPWKLKRPKLSSDTQSQDKKKCKKPRKKVDPINYLQQKAMQRKREKAIRDKLEHLSNMLPWVELKRNRPSRKEILERAISRIIQLQEDIREAYLQKGLKTEDVKAALQDNLMINLSDGPLDTTDPANEVSTISDESSSFPGTPELVINDSVPVTLPSPTSEVGSQESEEPVEVECAVKGVKTDEMTPHVKRPMNSFLLFSREYRGLFKRLYPGKDNRKISTLLAEAWRRMKPEEKQPYKDRQKELMRLTKESHPDFKY